MSSGMSKKITPPRSGFWRNFVRAYGELLDFNAGDDAYMRKILSRTPMETMRADWEAVGGDLWRAIGQEPRSGKTQKDD